MNLCTTLGLISTTTTLLSLLLLFTRIESKLRAAPSFFSSTSFERADVDLWPTHYNTCTSKPERLLEFPFVNPLVKKLQNDFSSIFVNKIPTPIEILQIPSNTRVVTGFERPLSFNAKVPVAKQFQVSFYMTPSVIPIQSFLHPGMELDFDVEFSHVRALTLSIPQSSSNLATEFFGFGTIEETPLNVRRRKSGNELLYQFKQAVFLGAPASVPNFASHEVGGETFPMEIYLYFASPKCHLPECTLQLVVLVQEGADDNPQIEPIIKAAEALYNEEIKFISDIEDLGPGLDEFANVIYDRSQPDLLHHWNELNSQFERIHVIHYYRAAAYMLFDTVEEVTDKLKLAKEQLFETEPFFDFSKEEPEEDLIIQFLKKNEFDIPAFIGRYDSIRTTVLKVLEVMRNILNKAALSTKETYNIDAEREEIMQLLELITIEFDNIAKFGNIISMKFPATQELRDAFGDIDENELTNSNIHEFKMSSFQEYFTAIKTYIFYYLDVVAPTLRQVAAFDRIMHLVNIDLPSRKANMDVGANHAIKFMLEWKNALSILPEQIVKRKFESIFEMLHDSRSPTLNRSIDTDGWLHHQAEVRAKVPRFVVQDKFQISWLIPHQGGYFEYTGSTPFPPCHMMSQTIVFETPIQLSASQIQRLSRVPRGSTPGVDITNTRPFNHAIPSRFDPFTWFPEDEPNPNRTLFKYNGADPEWFGSSDGFHNLTVKPKSDGHSVHLKFNGHYNLVLALVTMVLT